MRVRGTVDCPIAIKAETGSIGSLRLTLPAENGVVTLAGDRVSYRPSPAFRGRDFFAIALQVRSASFQGTSIARVHVFVR